MVIHKKLYILFLLSISTGFYAVGQNVVCLGDDISVCVGETVQINNCGGAQLPGGNGIVLQNPTSVSLSDDSWSGLINIGFSFSFYGNNYNQCVIGSNGLVSFNSSNANGYNSWSLTGVNPLPNSSFGDAKNSAMLCYSDINPGAFSGGGDIYYETIGVSPHRQFCVVYANIPMYGASDCNYMSLILNEGSNEVEFHIANKTINYGWNGGIAAQGVENSSGTVATATPGRNFSQWAANNDGQLFKPTAANNTSAYTVTPIPFKLIISDNADFEWENTLGQTFPYNNGTLIVNNVQPGTIGYFLTVTGTNCSSQVGAISDTTFITGLSSGVSATAIDDICSAGIGTVYATPTGGSGPYSFLWPGLGNVTTDTVHNVSAGTYIVKMTDGNGCGASATVVVGDTPAAYLTDSTLVSCPGGSDGTATVEMSPELGNVTYQWNDPNNQTTKTATGLSEGIYECIVTSDIGCSNTVQVEVTSIPMMKIQVVNQTNVTCNSGNDGSAEVIVTEGSAPYSYSWSASSSADSIAKDLNFGTHTLTVTDNKSCVITKDIEINQPDQLEIINLSQDTIICIDDSVQLFTVGKGGSSLYNFEWTIENKMVANGDTVYVTPTSPSTEYCVTLTEQCGSPKTTKCVMVDYPSIVDIQLQPDTTGTCYPVVVNFDNMTNTLENIDYTVWSYGDGEVDTIPGSSSVMHEFGEGIFDVQMEITTDRGCKYVRKFAHLIQGYSYPIADFYITPNPGSIYDPKVEVYSQSSNDVISFEWYAEDATPNFSTLKDLTFVYSNEIEDYPILLVVENEYQCVDSIRKIVSMESDLLLFAPNSFTPNGDGSNDYWEVQILGIDIHDFHLEIYNRWGEMVFESFDSKGRWDGTYGNKIAPSGTYIWRITASDRMNEKKHIMNGVVNLLK